MSERQRILSELLVELEHTRRRRIVRRRVGAGVTAAALVSATVAIAYVGAMSQRRSLATPPSMAQIVRTDAEVLSRYVVETGSAPALAAVVETSDVSLARIEMLDDRQLCDALASIGRPAGIVRSGGRVWLTSAVTDAERPQGS
jgi:hypothetical protein